MTRSKVIAEASRALANAALVLADALETEDVAPGDVRDTRAPMVRMDPVAAESVGAFGGSSDDEIPHGYRRNSVGTLERL